MKIEISPQAQNLYQKALIADLALGFEPEIEYPHKWAALQKYADAGFSYVSLHVATDATSLEKTVQHIAAVSEKIRQQAHQYHLIKTPEDIAYAKANKKLGISFVFQGTNPIAKSLDMIDAYYDLGVRSMILSYNTRNAVGDGCAEPTDAGLSLFGKKVVERMNRAGMLIDASHTGYKTAMDAIHHSTAPVIFSHSNVYAIHPHPRNLKDDLINAVAQSNGVIGINGIGTLLGDETASAEKYVEHIDYIAQLIGVKYIALGSDQIYFSEIMEDFLKDHSAMYPDNYTASVSSGANNQWNSRRPEQLIEVVELLLRRNYSEIDIKNILGGNYLRVVKEVWRS